MKKLVMLLFCCLCFGQAKWEKGIGVSTNYNLNKNRLAPGIAGKIYYAPKFSQFNNFELGLQFDLSINGGIYKYETQSGDSLKTEYDLDVNQNQSLDIIFRKSFAKGDILISLIPLTHSESEFSEIFTINNLLGRAGFKFKFYKLFLEVYLRRNIKNPQLGILVNW